MIFRCTLPQTGDKRTLTRRAWLPQRIHYENEIVWCWLEQYVVEQTYATMCSSNFVTLRWCRAWWHPNHGHWCTQNVITLVDACLEKLNPKPVPVAPPAPTQSQFAASMAQYQNAFGQQSWMTQLGGLGGMPSQGFGQSVTYTKQAGTP